jgi:hypothetical protein
VDAQLVVADEHPWDDNSYDERENWTNYSAAVDGGARKVDTSAAAGAVIHLCAMHFVGSVRPAANAAVTALVVDWRYSLLTHRLQNLHSLRGHYLLTVRKSRETMTICGALRLPLEKLRLIRR